MSSPPSPEDEALESALWEFLGQLEEWLETPMVILGFVWLMLLISELIWGIGGFSQALVLTIWAIFALDFMLRFLLAPRKRVYLRRNWLTVLSLGVPALRVVRVVQMLRLIRLVQATRTVQFVAIVGSLNRGMRSLRASMSRHGLQYILALTVIVVLVSSAGLHAFERRPGEASGYNTYGESVWRIAMIITTLGSEAWPTTGQGRLLTLGVSMYAFGVLGYITAAITSFLVGRDADSAEGEVAGEKALAALRGEIRALREEVQQLRGEVGGPPEQ